MNITALLTSAGINIVLCVILFSLYAILRKQPGNVNVYFGRRILSRRSKSLDLCLERFVPSPTWVMKSWETTQDEILSVGGLDAVVFSRMVVFSIRVFSVAAIICVFLVLPVNYYGQNRIRKEIPLESLEVFTIENVKEGSRWLWAHCLALYIITLTACSLLYFEFRNISNLRLVHITESPANPSHFAILVRGIPWSSDQTNCETVKKFFSYYHESTYLSHQIVYKSGTVQKLKECAAAFVFFKSRYAALMAGKNLQTSNPMLWVTDQAPEPHDVYWSNLCIPYRQLWIRKIATLVASISFVLVFLIPVTFAQGLTQLDKLEKMFPFLTEILQKQFMVQLATGYLPSVILVLFLCGVPPVMMLFSAVEGPISRSGRKKSACYKVLYFTIWNVFFVNVFAGSVISQLSVFTSITELPAQLAKAVPAQATFFTTYVLSSGWASLAFEIIQPFPLFCNLFQRFVLCSTEDSLDGLSFPYHTEVPRLLLFGFLGFTCSILAPLILPFLLFYFFLAYIVYRNQILNVYVTKYDGGGQLWPIAHNTTVFSLLVAQFIAIGVFGLKRSTAATGFTIPLLIGTVLFHQYCRQRFLPVFRNNAAQVLIDMDQRDEHCGRMEEIYDQLHSAYCQFSTSSSSQSECCSNSGDRDPVQTPEDMETGKEVSQQDISWPVHL